MNLDTLLTSMTAGPCFTSVLYVTSITARASDVLATYNRCPFDPSSGRLRDNPLTWALDSLLAQAGHALAEIVVADDGSADHTQAVLETYLSCPDLTRPRPGHPPGARPRYRRGL